MFPAVAMVLFSQCVLLPPHVVCLFKNTVTKAFSPKNKDILTMNTYFNKKKPIFLYAWVFREDALGVCSWGCPRSPELE